MSNKDTQENKSRQLTRSFARRDRFFHCIRRTGTDAVLSCYSEIVRRVHFQIGHDSVSDVSFCTGDLKEHCDRNIVRTIGLFVFEEQYFPRIYEKLH